ncbi:hypothetical protein [Streptantibioticus silvisoli]|jgi:hypothetical protein|uniref:Uncharacterized protein n=1 Tax=Streptantibioticus silvisoli TaxID=2705255 RepID=A0ABT6W4N8_9ACTN|nr:hypothetical protein [Streptantibioticus silvisoli]MDI5965335.1 hypothetical protein [Streptantibioticus silvisoli]
MLPEPEPVGGVPSPKSLKITKDTLTKFKKAIDTALSELDDSAASHTRVSLLTMAAPAYGQGFTAATELAASYVKVHDNLQTLSKSLGDQLEALGIAVECAHRGFENVDAKQTERLRAIQSQTEKQYARYQDKQHPQHQAQGGKHLGGDGL